jgi:hypothetical protein
MSVTVLTEIRIDRKRIYRGLPIFDLLKFANLITYSTDSFTRQFVASSIYKLATMMIWPSLNCDLQGHHHQSFPLYARLFNL